MPKGELRFSRHACFGSDAQDVLTAIGHVLSSLAARGFEVPADASVQVRASGFGYAATLHLPERFWDGDCYVLCPKVRRSSGVLPRVDDLTAEPSCASQTRARSHGA